MLTTSIVKATHQLCQQKERRSKRRVVLRSKLKSYCRVGKHRTKGDNVEWQTRKVSRTKEYSSVCVYVVTWFHTSGPGKGLHGLDSHSGINVAAVVNVHECRPRVLTVHTRIPRITVIHSISRHLLHHFCPSVHEQRFENFHQNSLRPSIEFQSSRHRDQPRTLRIAFVRLASKSFYPIAVLPLFRRSRRYSDVSSMTHRVNNASSTIWQTLAALSFGSRLAALD